MNTWFNIMMDNSVLSPLPYEIIGLIYEYLHIPIDVVNFMLACRQIRSYIPKNVRQTLFIQKLRAGIHNDIRSIGYYIAEITNDDELYMELAVSVQARKLVIYELVRDDIHILWISNNNYTYLVEDDFIDEIVTKRNPQWYLKNKCHHDIIETVMPLLKDRGIKTDNLGICM